MYSVVVCILRTVLYHGYNSRINNECVKMQGASKVQGGKSRDPEFSNDKDGECIGLNTGRYCSRYKARNCMMYEDG